MGGKGIKKKERMKGEKKQKKKKNLIVVKRVVADIQMLGTKMAQDDILRMCSGKGGKINVGQWCKFDDLN